MRACNLRFLVAVAVAVAVTTMSGCAWPPDVGTTDPAASSSTPAPIFPDDAVAPLVDGVPQRTVTALPVGRLAEGLIPPTNRWFSGLVFGEPSMPVFPLPLSFQLTDNGMSFGLPAVSSSSAVIMGGFLGAITADVGAQEQEVVAYDTASVTVSQRADAQEIGRTVIAQGSPFVTFTASSETTVRMKNPFTPSSEDGVATATVGATT